MIKLSSKEHLQEGLQFRNHLQLLFPAHHFEVTPQRTQQPLPRKGFVT